MSDRDAAKEHAGRKPYIDRPPGPRPPDAPRPFPYRVRANNRSVERDWDSMARTHATNLRKCFDHLATNPTGRPIDTGRVTALGGRLAGLYEYEVAGAARVVYKVDEAEKIVIVVLATLGHPKMTE